MIPTASADYFFELLSKRNAIAEDLNEAVAEQAVRPTPELAALIRKAREAVGEFDDIAVKVAADVITHLMAAKNN
jgi:hypothetical protein